MTGYFHGGLKQYWWRERFPIHEIRRIDGGRGFQTRKNVFRIGGNTFYNRKRKFRWKFWSPKGPESNWFRNSAEFRTNFPTKTVPPPSCCPMQLLHVPPLIAPPALPIVAQAVLRVSYSQRAVPRVWCSQHTLSVSYSQCHPLRVWCSQREGMLGRWHWESIILSVGGAESWCKLPRKVL